MASTRIPASPRLPRVASFGRLGRLLQHALLSFVAACAQGVDPSDSTDLLPSTTTDAARPVVEMTPDSSEPVVSVSNGDNLLPPPVDTTKRDAGTDAGVPGDGTLKPTDAGMPSNSGADAGTSTPVMDAGGSSTPDAQVTMDASLPKDTGTEPEAAMPPPQVCSATPAYPTTTNCAKCVCSKCGSQVAACYASSDSAKNTQCGIVQACAEKQHCTGSDCYCGVGVSTLACAFNQTGACKKEIETAAGSTDPTKVQSDGNDTSTALGRANAIGTCERANCAKECGL